MELSLQSRKNYKSMRKIRQIMITKEKLKINDKISYERFLQLYKKYGDGIDEKDFAKVVLDIPNQKHYYLQCGKTKNTPVLSREYVSSREIERIRKNVESFVKSVDEKDFYYDTIEYLYNKYGGILDIATFAEDVLGISAHQVECLKSDRKRTTKFFKKKIADRVEIRKRQNTIILSEKLHIDDTITKSQFEELYSKYGEGISEDFFATKVLQIPKSRFNRLMNGKNKYTTILSAYIYNPESVEKLREHIIKREGLHVEELINYERFKELHNKYGAPLSEELFAEEVLDISAVGVKNMRVAGDNYAILTEIEIPNQFILELRSKVASENKLRQNQHITLEKIKLLYEKYGGILLQKKFATLVLDISSDSYNALVNGTNKETKILKNYEQDRFFALRRKIIFEKDLKYGQEINYEQFLNLYNEYGENENETIFAEKTLDIPQKKFYNLKYGTTQKVNILLNEYLPNDEELYKLKIQIGIEYGLHIKDKINYKKFFEIYKKYSGILNEDLFAEKIFDIKKATLLKIKKDSEREAEIFRQTKLSDEEIKKLRREVILDNNIYPEREITKSMFEKMYKGHKHILSEKMFAKKILGIETQSINKLKKKACKSVKALLMFKKDYLRKTPYLNDTEVELLKECLIQGFNEEYIATRLGVTMPYLKKNLDMLYRYGRLSTTEIESIRIARGIDSTNLKVKEPQIGNTRKKEEKNRKRREEEAQKTRKKARKVIDEFELTENDFKVVHAYISNCKERFAEGEFPEMELPDLEESIGFVGGGISEIEFFAKVCISFGLYKKASVFISNNIDNEGLSEKQKLKLRESQKLIKYASAREEAVNMISKGIRDSKYISHQTGLAEVDVLELQNRLRRGDKINIREWLNKAFDDGK